MLPKGQTMPRGRHHELVLVGQGHHQVQGRSSLVQILLWGQFKPAPRQKTEESLDAFPYLHLSADTQVSRHGMAKETVMVAWYISPLCTEK